MIINNEFVLRVLNCAKVFPEVILNTAKANGWLAESIDKYRFL